MTDNKKEGGNNTPPFSIEKNYRPSAPNYENNYKPETGSGENRPKPPAPSDD